MSRRMRYRAAIAHATTPAAKAFLRRARRFPLRHPIQFVRYRLRFRRMVRDGEVRRASQ